MKTKYTSTTVEFDTACGKMYLITLYDDLGNIFKVMPELGKTGSCSRAQLTAYAEVITVMLRNCQNDVLLKALTSAKGNRCNSGSLPSCIDVLNEYLLEEHLKKCEDEEDEIE